jgi:choline dehydrogenase-like flavoprotein
MPSDVTIQDWGITYDELEPYYDRFEYLCGTSGTAGNLRGEIKETSLSAQMDPEDLREVISAYQTCVADRVQRFDGFVAKYMGDGVLVYFGYPQAHEDDAERAVRAALEAIAAVGALKLSVPPANPRRYRDRAGGCWRSDRIRGGAGAPYHWGNAEYCCAPSRLG